MIQVSFWPPLLLFAGTFNDRSSPNSGLGPVLIVVKPRRFANVMISQMNHDFEKSLLRRA